MIITRKSKTKTTAYVLCAMTILCLAGLALVAYSPTDSDKYINEQWYLSTNNENSEKFANNKNSQKNIKLISGINHIRKGNQPRKSEDTVVAVIDTQVDWSHEDLMGKAWKNVKEIPNDHIDNDDNGYIDDSYGYNYLDGKGISSLESSNSGAHGTAITGLICANASNGVGIAGLTGKAHVKVMNLVVLDSVTTEGSVSNLIKAIRYAEKNGAKICNISANYTETNEELFDVIHQSTMLFVVSAGNRPTLGLSIDEVANIPAMYNFDNVLTVSALTQECRILRQANYGMKTVDILAPGDEMLAPLPENQYAYFSGTSIATPIVASLAALLDQNAENISASDLKKQILALASHNDDFKFKIKDGAYLRLTNILFR